MTEHSGIPGLGEFLCAYPQMAVRPSAGAACTLKGRFAFQASFRDKGEITDRYELSILVPSQFPGCLPQVIETGRRIPRDASYHVNPSDNTLCLGSPIRLMLKLSRKPTLTGFAELCLVPYLFAMSRKLQSGGPFAFDELQHGTKGILIDYADLFGLKTPEQARYALALLGMKKRRANKQPCPCACGKRLGRCKFNVRIRQFRQIASRSWFRTSAS